MGEFTVNLWSSHPDDDNDDCNAGFDFPTLEAALKVFEAADPIAEMGRLVDAERKQNDCPPFASYYGDTPFIELDGPEVYRVRKLREPRKRRDDGEWQREQAMQAGMAFGCEGYNEAMGWD